MEKQISSTTKSDPIIIEQAGMRMTVAHRQNLNGNNEKLTFDITTATPKDEGKRILRFDCFYKNPHYHIGASGERSVHNMKDEGVEDPVRWTLEQLKTRFPSMVKEAGYEEIAEKMGCPIGTVRSRIFRARDAIDAKLRPLLSESQGYDHE